MLTVRVSPAGSEMASPLMSSPTSLRAGMRCGTLIVGLRIMLAMSEMSVTVMIPSPFISAASKMKGSGCISRMYWAVATMSVTVTSPLSFTSPGMMWFTVIAATATLGELYSVKSLKVKRVFLSRTVPSLASLDTFTGR